MPNEAAAGRHRSDLPSAVADESPIEFADRLGRWYGALIDDERRKSNGHYLTPPPVARYMGRLAARAEGATVRLLDPAAGAGVLAAAACEAIATAKSPPKSIDLVLYEINHELVPVLDACVAHLHAWLARRKITLRSRLHVCDFVLDNAGALGAGLFAPGESFDAVICNPPYFKLQKTDPRAQACLEVVHGQPNLYGLFMALGAALLRPGGRLTFITPRSFASGPYFRRFRSWFFDRIQVSELHVFESRTEAFDSVLQETVITAGTRNGSVGDTSIRLSSSSGSADIDSSRVRILSANDVIRPTDRKDRIVHLPIDERDDRVREIVGAWKGSLAKFGMTVSTGPVVAFRARAFLRNESDTRHVPLLWLQHVKPMAAVWPLLTRKPEFIDDCDGSQPILLPNRNYVLLRRFTAKEEDRRLVAAPCLAESFPYRKIGLENHLNYIHRPNAAISRDEAIGLAALLNSELLDAYVRISSGNTQVSATELRALPLPPLASIKRIGRRLLDETCSLEEAVASETEHVP